MILPESPKNFCNFLSVSHCAALTDFVNLSPRVYGIFLASQSVSQPANQAINHSFNQSIVYVHFNKSSSHFGLNIDFP